MKIIFMVQLDWSTADADGIETELYEDYDTAYDRYKEIISEQLKNFWDGKVVFDTDGDPGDEYEFSEDDNNSNNIIKFLTYNMMSVKVFLIFFIWAKPTI